jgi:hypothetical protein
MRTPDGGLAATDMDLAPEPEWMAGGHGATSTAEDSGRFISMLLRGGTAHDGARVLVTGGAARGSFAPIAPVSSLAAAAAISVADRRHHHARTRDQRLSEKATRTRASEYPRTPALRLLLGPAPVRVRCMLTLSASGRRMA